MLYALRYTKNGRASIREESAFFLIFTAASYINVKHSGCEEGITIIFCDSRLMRQVLENFPEENREQADGLPRERQQLKLKLGGGHCFYVAVSPSSFLRKLKKYSFLLPNFFLSSLLISSYRLVRFISERSSCVVTLASIPALKMQLSVSCRNLLGRFCCSTVFPVDPNKLSSP